MIDLDWRVAFVSLCYNSFCARPLGGKNGSSRRPQWICGKRKQRGSTNGKSGGRNRSAKRSVFYDAMKVYRGHFEPLLDAELEAEQMAFLEQRDMDRYRDVYGAMGYTLRDLRARKEKRLFSLNVYKLFLKISSGGAPVSNEFAKGDLVNLTPDRADDDRLVEGTVLAKYPTHLLITVPIGSEGAMQMETFVDNNERLRAECGTNSIAHERALNALIELTTAGRSAADIAKLVIMSLSFMLEVDSEASGLWANRHGLGGLEDQPLDVRPVCSSEDDSEASKWHSFSKETVSRITPQDMSRVIGGLPGFLNSSQIAAIKAALRRRLTLIQGPPGTGKTFTIAHMICCCAKLRLGPVLACSASNVAADNLMRKIIEASPKSLRIVRIGRVPAIEGDLWDKTLESRLELDPGVKKARESCAAGVTKVSELREIEKNIAHNILKNADVVVGTCVACGRDELQALQFQFLVVDEATQASEPDVLIPLSVCINRGSQAQLVLIGDQHQLPPTILSEKQGQTIGMGLKTSLFQRLWLVGLDTQLLNVQYRMHPQIASFPSSHFYFKRLRDGIEARERPFPTLFEEQSTLILTKSRTVFLKTSHAQEEADSKANDVAIWGHSYCNRIEAEVVLKVVGELLGSGVHQTEALRAFSLSDIGVISPYAGQVRLIKQMLGEKGLRDVIEVSTVDGFQGREKNVIVLSSVRSNKDGEVGFLRDWRRLNVAITRARILLIVVGNEDTLSNDSHWRSWIRWVKRHGTSADV